MLNLVIAVFLRLQFWTGEPWNLWVPVVVTLISGGVFVILAIDEDKEALEIQRRPYSTQAVVKASPVSHRE